MSACEKALNRRCPSSELIPMPVSHTVQRTRAQPSGSLTKLSLTLTWPWLVNLTAFEIRLLATWVKRCGSPKIIQGSSPTADSNTS